MYKQHQWWFRQKSIVFHSERRLRNRISTKRAQYHKTLAPENHIIDVKSSFFRCERNSRFSHHSTYFSTQFTNNEINEHVSKPNTELSEGGDSRDYVLQHVPSSSSQNKNLDLSTEKLSSSSSPMEKILEAWADAATYSPISNGGNEPIKLNTIGMGSTEGVNASKEAAVKQTLSWFNHMVNQQEDRKQNIAGTRNLNITTSTFNVVLQMLAEKTDMASNFFIGSNDEIYGGTEQKAENETKETEINIALRILQKMKSSQDVNSRPNIETYNAYIACIRRPTPIEAADEAESILKELHSVSMSSPDEPVPDVETYNAVLTWYAMDYNNNDMAKIEQLYQEMTQEKKIIPNRRTFQIILHFCSKRISNENGFQFDTEISPHHSLSEEQIEFLKPHHTQLWIHRMSNVLGRESVDKDIWNLTIPLSSSKCVPSSLMMQTKIANPSSSSVSPWKTDWDDRQKKLFPKYNETLNNLLELYRYQNLVPPSDPDAQRKIETALNLEKWIEYIVKEKDSAFIGNESATKREEEENQSSETLENVHEDLQLDPTMEAVDAIILAWVDTKTKEGLVRAETVALNALDFPHLKKEGIHVNSFLPILTAWAMCGEEYGVQRVEEWITKLEELSKQYEEEKIADGNNHNLKPNSHVYAAAIQSSIMYQTALLQERSSEHNEAILHAAHQCTAWLEKLCSLDPDPDLHVVPLDGSVFAHAIDSWMRVLRSQLFGITPNKQNIEKVMRSSLYQDSSNKIFDIVELMNSKIIKKNINHPEVFDLVSTFHDVYGIALRPFKYAKFLGKDDLQVNSRFIQIQQMLQISDILYPHLIEDSDRLLNHKTSLSQLMQATSRLTAFSHPRFVNLCRNHLNERTLSVTVDEGMPQYEKMHTYNFFYIYLLRLSRTLPTSLSKGLKLKIYYGILDRITSPISPMLEPDSDKSKLLSFFINDCHGFTSTFDERSCLLDRVIEHGIKEVKEPKEFFDSIEKSIKQPYAIEPDTCLVDSWIDDKNLYCQEVVNGGARRWHLNL